MGKKLIDGHMDPFDEFRSVILNLIRCLDSRGGLKLGDKIDFNCCLTKCDYDGRYNIENIDVEIKKHEN